MKQLFTRIFVVSYLIAIILNLVQIIHIPYYDDNYIKELNNHLSGGDT
mgnify:CR=1 FL=1